MTWTLDLKLTTRRRIITIQDALGGPRWAIERFSDGSRGIHLGPLEVSMGRRKG